MRARLIYAVLFSVATGVALVSGLKAQSKPRAYYVTQIELTGDAQEFGSGYGSKVGATLEPYGGRFLVRGAKAISLEGEARPRNAVIEFPDLDQAQAWYNSPAYQRLIPIRQRLTRTTSYIVEGVSP